MARSRDPDVAMALVETAARLLTQEGRKAVTARRIAAAVETSTMSVYTHFGSMDDLLQRVWQEGFARFAGALDGPAVTADPVADWLAQGWAYRRFALDNPHLYDVMFGEGMIALRAGEPSAAAEAYRTFEALLTRLERCVAAGRFQLDDLALAGETVWATVHGHMTIELTGYFQANDRDPTVSYAACMRVLGRGFGDDTGALQASMAAARRRTRRTR